MASSDQLTQKFWGLLTRKERWGLSWSGTILALTVSVGLAISAVLSDYPFLAMTQRVNANVLVVEGWVHNYAIRSAVEEFKTGSYQRVFTTGGPVVGNGGYVNDYQTSASVGADLLEKFGVPSEAVQMVPSHVMGRERTYSSALALRDWLRDQGISVGSFNVLTEDFHARRTRLLSEKAFGKDAVVGIIAVPSHLLWSSSAPSGNRRPQSSPRQPRLQRGFSPVRAAGRNGLISSSLLSAITLASFLIGLPFGPAGVAIAAFNYWDRNRITRALLFCRTTRAGHGG